METKFDKLYKVKRERMFNVCQCIRTGEMDSITGLQYIRQTVKEMFEEGYKIGRGVTR